MTDLLETSIWEPGVYQLEDIDAMKGGVPDPVTKQGIDNVPHLQLARRTLYLKEQIERGIQAWDVNRNYVAGDVVTDAGAIWMATGVNAGSAPTASNPSWDLIWSTGSSDAVFAIPGRMRLGNGFYLNFGQVTVPHRGTVTVPYLLAFPNAALFGLVTPGSAINNDQLSFGISVTQANCTIKNAGEVSGSVAASVGAFYLVVGY